MNASSSSNPRARNVDLLVLLRGRIRRRIRAPLQSAPPAPPIIPSIFGPNPPPNPPTNQPPLASTSTPAPASINNAQPTATPAPAAAPRPPRPRHRFSRFFIKTPPTPQEELRTPSKYIWKLVMKHLFWFDPSPQASMLSFLSAEQEALLELQRGDDFATGFCLGAIFTILTIQIWLLSAEGGPMSLEALREWTLKFWG